jgi:hypothetical protein
VRLRRVIGDKKQGIDDSLHSVRPSRPDAVRLSPDCPYPPIILTRVRRPLLKEK